MIPCETSYTLEPTSGGTPTITVTSEGGARVYLHSAKNPLREAESITSRLRPDTYNTLIILGAGLGYHLIPLAERASEYARILVFDIHPGIDTAIASIPSTQFLLHTPRIFFFPGKSGDEIEQLLHDHISFDESIGIQVIEHPASVRAYPAYYTEIRKTIEKVLSQKAANRATVKAFGARYFRNILFNIARFESLHPVKTFFSTMREYPAVVLTSGPSLDDFVETLAKIQDRVFILCVDSALPVLKRTNITPDFVVSIDPQPLIAEHFLGSPARRWLPIYSISSHPVPLSFTGGLLSLTTHPLSQVIDELSPGAVGTINSHTGTVAGDAVFAAFRFGFRSCALIGFDFSFPDYAIYARGTAYQNRFALYHATRTEPGETRNFNYVMKSSGGFRSCGKFTRKSFVHYKETLESAMQSNGISNFYNIQSRGMPLSHVPSITMKNFIDTSCAGRINKREYVHSILADAPSCANSISSTELRKILSDTKLVQSILKASFDMAHGEVPRSAMNALSWFLQINNVI